MSDKPGNPAACGVRTDVQVLRGIAVLLVVFYHSGLAGLSGGYLGVDVFFVVSGYLIAGLIMRDIDRGEFSLRQFFLRRARRLLPAASMVFLLTAIAARYLLTESELQSFTAQLLGAVFAAGNVVLWLQSGYFDTESHLKPLLHTWSLGVEEQFYLVMPCLLLLLAPKRRLFVLALGTLASFALCVVVLERWPDAAFYWLPTRAWELGLGAVGACLPALAASRRRMAVGWIAVSLILGLALHPLDFVYPRVDALLVCLATVWLLLTAPAFLRSAWTVPLARVGDISYALYLVHWPLLAFANNYYAGDVVPRHVTLQLIGAAFIGAAILHVAIEKPFRRAPVRTLRTSTTALLILPLLMLPPVVQAAPALTNWQHERRPGVGLDAFCDFNGAFQPLPECSVGKPPRILVWGDSIAMLWVMPLKSAGVVQATMSTCAPMLGASPVYQRELGPAWAQRCIAFNDSVLAWLKSQPQISHVVLSSRFSYNIEVGQRLLTRTGVVPQGVDVAAKAMQDTVHAVRELGKQVVIMAPPPLATFDVGICLEREAKGMPIGGRANCEIDYVEYMKSDEGVIALLRKVEVDAKVSVLRPSDLLCDAASCKTTLDGVPLYRDKTHFSYRGADAFARRFELDKKILAQ